MIKDHERKEIARAVEQAQKELYTDIFLSECGDNAGIRAIYSKRADWLSTLIYYAKLHMEE